MILDTLKRETLADHIGIEQRFNLPSRLQSAGEYGRLLSYFWGFYAPVEERLAARGDWASYGIEIQQRLKAHLAIADLRALGWAPPALADLPRCQELPALDSFAQAAGCLYVLEGATLGGQYIARQTERALGLTPQHGCSFFTSYGERVGPMWLALRKALNDAEQRDLDAAAVVGGARETFRCFDRWLASSEERP